MRSLAGTLLVLAALALLAPPVRAGGAEKDQGFSGIGVALHPKPGDDGYVRILAVIPQAAP